MICQLQSLAEAGEEFSFFEKLPQLFLRNLYHIFKALKKPAFKPSENLQSRQKEKISFPILKLKPGEKVRVKSLEEIKLTLDEHNKCQGLAYTPSMNKYCEGTYTVLKRVEKIFDERRWRLVKLKNVVILDGVYCDGAGGLDKAWDGCDRTCFILWKEAWLERISTE